MELFQDVIMVVLIWKEVSIVIVTKVLSWTEISLHVLTSMNVSRIMETAAIFVWTSTEAKCVNVKVDISWAPTTIHAMTLMNVSQLEYYCIIQDEPSCSQKMSCEKTVFFTLTPLVCSMTSFVTVPKQQPNFLNKNFKLETKTFNYRSRYARLLSNLY